MWESFDDLASRVDVLEKEKVPIMALSDQGLSEMLKELYQPYLKQSLETPSLRFDKFQTQKKEEPKVSTLNLELTAEGLSTFIRDLQEMATDKKRKMDERGNYVFDANGDYMYIDIPLAEREVAIGNVRITEEGKFALKVDSSTFAKMEAQYAQKARIEKYQAS